MKRLRSTPIVMALSVLVVAATFTHGFGVFAATCVSSSDCQSQINSLSAQNDQAQNSLTQLEVQAGSYEAAIAALQGQINTLQNQIDADQAQQAQIEQQIAQNQQKLEQQKQTLAADLKAMYVNGQMSNVEMLATSNNLSDYIDKQEAYSKVQDNIQNTLDQITALQKQLQTQKAQIDQLLTALNTQQSQLAAARNAQNSLLSYNESQQANFNNQIASNQAQIASLRRQQASMIQSGTRGVYIPPASGGSGGACDAGNGNGRYPMSWCNAAQDTVATIPYSSDPINRECTSYAYWYFTQVEGHTDFRATGNANQWAYTSNYPVHAAPAVGSIAVETSGYYGHVAIVQALPGQNYAGNVVPDGYVLVSEMNYDWNGHFRYSYSPLSKFSDYIY